MKKSAIVTGGSRGIGFAITEMLIMEGYHVFELSRNGIDREGVTHVKCDLANSNELQAAMEQILSQEIVLDVVIANAGYGIAGTVEGTEPEDIENQLHVNVLASMLLAKICLPYIRRDKGRIIFISSIAAILPIPYQAFYSSAKASLNAFAEALDLEIKPLGCRSLVIMPGDTKTDFTANRKFNQEDPQEYKSRMQNSLARMEKDEISGPEPATVAETVRRQLYKKNPKCLCSVGINYKVFSVLAKILPNRIKAFILGKMYG